MNGYNPGLYCPDHRQWLYPYHRTAADERCCEAVVRGWVLVACQMAVVGLLWLLLSMLA